MAKPRYADANPYVVAYLRTGDYVRDRQIPGIFECFRLTGPHARGELRQIWLELRDEILDAWIAERPGTRPYGWWEFDAPRWRPEAWCRDLSAEVAAWFCEPRRRVGGIGTPTYDVLNVMPEFAFGVPTSWVSRYDELHYEGFTGLAPRADDPPRFESQASYLDRHGLLPAAERRVLTATDFAPEILELPVDDDDADRPGRTD
jgi:hypothetical protein